MTKLEERVAELEKQVRELQARPVYYPAPYPVPYYPPMNPYPNWQLPQIWCGSTSGSTGIE